LLNLKFLFLGIITFTAIQKIAELLLAKKNEKALIKNGAIVTEEKFYPLMILLHVCWVTTVFLLSFFSNHQILLMDFYPWLFIYLVGFLFKMSAIKTLGHRWTIKIINLPEEKLIEKGPFRFTKHPYYFGVILQVISLPCIGSFYIVGIIFSSINFILLLLLIRKEEEALVGHYDH
jgi:methyltransferase